MNSNRTEAFSDGVFAIALTLLVLELKPPTDDPRTSYGMQLLRDWPVYVAYLAAFLTIAAIWLNHHALFFRVARVDPRTLLLNLGLLLGTSLVPWPTGLIADAVRMREAQNQRDAIFVYAIVTVLVTVPWLLLNLHLARRPDLLHSATAVTWLRRNARVAASSFVLAAAGPLLALASPVSALLLLLAAPVAYLAFNVRANVPDVASM